MTRLVCFLVGIDHYNQPEWDLSGPCHNALKIASALLRLVAPQDMVLFLGRTPSSPDISDYEKVQEASARGLQVRYESHRDPLDGFWRKELLRYARDGAGLLVYWSGHAFTGGRNDRICICTDFEADSLRDRVVNFSGMMRGLKTNKFARFREQIMILDACGSFARKVDLLVPDENFPQFHLEQAALFSSREGESTRDQGKGTLFTTACAEEFETWDRWVNPEAFVTKMASALVARNLAPHVHVWNKSGLYPIACEATVDIPFGDGNIQIREVRKQERLPHTNTIANVAISPRETELAFSADDSVYSLQLSGPFPNFVGAHEVTAAPDDLDATLSPAELRQLELAHQTRVTALTFTSTGTYLVSGDASGCLCLFHLHDGRAISLRPHVDVITSVASSPRGDLFCSASTDEQVKVWRAADVAEGHHEPMCVFEKASRISRKAKHEHDIERIYATAFSTDGDFLATGDQQGVIVVREIRSGRELLRRKIHRTMVTDLMFRPNDGMELLSSSSDGRVMMTGLGGHVRSIVVGGHETTHDHYASSVAYSGDGRVAITSGDDRFIKVWDLAKNQLLAHHAVHGEERPVSRVRFFPHRYDFATNVFDSDVSVWRITTSGSIAGQHVRVTHQ